MWTTFHQCKQAYALQRLVPSFVVIKQPLALPGSANELEGDHNTMSEKNKSKIKKITKKGIQNDLYKENMYSFT